MFCLLCWHRLNQLFSPMFAWQDSKEPPVMIKTSWWGMAKTWAPASWIKKNWGHWKPILYSWHLDTLGTLSNSWFPYDFLLHIFRRYEMVWGRGPHTLKASTIDTYPRHSWVTRQVASSAPSRDGCPWVLQGKAGEPCSWRPSCGRPCGNWLEVIVKLETTGPVLSSKSLYYILRFN